MTTAVAFTSFPYLIDAPEDGGIESRGWLPVGAATTPTDAVRAFTTAYRSDTGSHPLEQRDPFEILVCDRSEFLRPSITVDETVTEAIDVCSGCGHRELVHALDRCIVTTHRAAGAASCACSAFTPVTREASVERELVGDAAIQWAREESYREEQLRYSFCERDDEGASEWWCIDVVDGCAAHVHENDDGDVFFCCKPKGHDGRCMPDLDGLPVREYFELQLIGDHDPKLANELDEIVRLGWRLSRVTYWFPEVQHARRSTPDGEPIPASQRERIRKIAHRHPPRAIVAAEVTYRGAGCGHGETIRKGSFDPTEAPA